MADNVLYYGDNLDILRRYVKDETVDLLCGSGQSTLGSPTAADPPGQRDVLDETTWIFCPCAQGFGLTEGRD